MGKKGIHGPFLLIAVGFFLFAISVGVIINSTPEGEHRALHFGTTVPESLWPSELYEEFSKEIYQKSDMQFEVFWDSVPEGVRDVGLLQRLYLRELDGAIIGTETLDQWLQGRNLSMEMGSLEKSLSKRLQPKGYDILTLIKSRKGDRVSAWIVRLDRLQGMDPTLQETLIRSAKALADKAKEYSN